MLLKYEISSQKVIEELYELIRRGMSLLEAYVPLVITILFLFFIFIYILKLMEIIAEIEFGKANVNLIELKRTTK